jgi:hypothetical protein
MSRVEIKLNKSGEAVLARDNDLSFKLNKSKEVIKCPEETKTTILPANNCTVNFTKVSLSLFNFGASLPNTLPREFSVTTSTGNIITFTEPESPILSVIVDPFTGGSTMFMITIQGNQCFPSAGPFDVDCAEKAKTDWNLTIVGSGYTVFEERPLTFYAGGLNQYSGLQFRVTPVITIDCVDYFFPEMGIDFV